MEEGGSEMQGHRNFTGAISVDRGEHPQRGRYKVKGRRKGIHASEDQRNKIEMTSTRGFEMERSREGTGESSGARRAPVGWTGGGRKGKSRHCSEGAGIKGRLSGKAVAVGGGVG